MTSRKKREKTEAFSLGGRLNDSGNEKREFPMMKNSLSDKLINKR